jgi:hypothetical protein
MGEYVKFFLNAMVKPLKLLFWDLPRKILDAPKKLVKLSLPARVATLVTIFLIICVVTVAAVYFFEPSNVPWRSSLTKGRIAAVLVLMVAIPVVVYKALQLWLEGDVSQYPDIDFAWNAGVTELARNGIDLKQTPIFLVLGSISEVQEKAIANAAQLQLRVREIPMGPAALHWYANPDGVYIFCTETCCQSKLASIAHKLESESTTLRPEPSATAGVNIRGTLVPSAVEPAADPIRTSSPVAAPAEPAPQRAPSIRGTMVVGGGAETDAVMTAGVPERAVAHLEPQTSVEQSRRFAYLCHLVRRSRDPLCPINGILTFLPYNLIRVGPGGAREVQRAVKADLTALTQTLKLRCPVTAVVAGMENESGFRELIRRVGVDRAAAQRFGKGFRLWTVPSPEQLEALCAHACGAFEDWVYSLFREKGSLGRDAGNKKLYSLLCTVRRDLKDRLTNLVAGGFGDDSDEKREAEPQLFGGCYFAATGNVEYHQAFLKGVFDKLPEQQEEVQWTQEALSENRRFLRLAYITFGLDLILFACLAGMIVFKYILVDKPQ